MFRKANLWRQKTDQCYLALEGSRDQLQMGMKETLGVVKTSNIGFWRWLYSTLNLLKSLNHICKMGNIIICKLHILTAIKTLYTHTHKYIHIYA